MKSVMRTVESLETLTKLFWAGINAKSSTASECPSKQRTCDMILELTKIFVSQMYIFLSKPAVAKYRSSNENRTTLTQRVCFFIT